MKILSWNCCLPPWALSRKQRLTKVIAAIMDISPDIVCLQEVFFQKDAAVFAASLQSCDFIDFFHYKDLFIASKSRLTGKRGGEFTKQGKIFSLAVLDALYGKGWQNVQFQNDGKNISLLNAHLLSAWALDSAGLQCVREKQVKEIGEIMEKGEEGKIILGDFNFQPDTQPYNIFLKKNFTDESVSIKNTLKNKKTGFHFFSKYFFRRYANSFF
jgi:endonuclease/exonuclease/phosphatase family metal-dependent hydrolase